MAQTVRFTSMDEATPAEITQVMGEAVAVLQAQLLPNVLGLLESLKGDQLGYQVDRYEHSLQTASRALRDGARTDLVVAAVFHDIGEGLAPANHAELAAAVLEPYLDEEATWVVRHHGVFSGYHYWHKMGGNRDARERYRSSPYFDVTARFVGDWDQAAFDPAYDTLPLDELMPMIREVFARPSRLERFGEDLPAPGAG
ncbi:MAG TPA: HD domain-containing protein [Acidimicrobiales bacterium]|nr:HD domain-containing protein [Acidimicrobiales bacterium]